MTLSILSAKKAGKNPSFFIRELLQTRTQLLLWSVAFFMALPVFSMSEVTGYSHEYVASATTKLRDISNPMYTAMWLMMAAAVISGVIAFSMFHSKKSAYFYLSLPVTRTELFVTRVITGVVPAVTAYLANAIVSMLIFAASPQFGFWEIIPAFAKLGAQALLLFFWIYAFTIFAASITSRAGASILLTAWIYLILPAYQLCLYVLFGFSAPHAYLPWLESETLVTYTVPVVRAVLLQNEMGDSYPRPYPDYIKITDVDFYGSFAWYEVALIITVSVLLIVASAFILKKRPAENAGESSVFRKVGEAIKLTLLIPSAILFALFFNELFGIFGLFFGVVWGVFVAFLILNLLIYRSGRKLFTGLKAASVLTILLVITVIAFLFIGSNIENREYTVENTESITVHVSPFDNMQLEPEKCEELLNYIAEKTKADKTGIFDTTNLFTAVAVPEDSFSLSASSIYYGYTPGYTFILKPKLGIGIEKYFSLDAEGEKLLYDAIRTSSKDGIGLFAALFPADEDEYVQSGSELYLNYNFAPIFTTAYTNEHKELPREMAAKIAERRAKEFLEGYSDGFAVGYVQYRSAKGGYVSLPVYITDGDILGMDFCTLDTLLEYVTKVTVYSDYLYKYGDGRVTEISSPELAVFKDKETIAELLHASIGSDAGYGGVYDRGLNQINLTFEIYRNGAIYTITTYPHRDKVPQIVTELLDELLAQYN